MKLTVLTVLYDADCPLCARCRGWMEGQAAFVTLSFLPCRSAEAQARYGQVPWVCDELVVVADDGRVWAGAAAFVMCLWALVDWREWSYRLSAPAFAPLARRFFQAVSTRRRRLATLLARGAPRCPQGGCAPQHPYRS